MGGIVCARALLACSFILILHHPAPALFQGVDADGHELVNDLVRGHALTPPSAERHAFVRHERPIIHFPCFLCGFAQILPGNYVG